MGRRAGLAPAPWAACACSCALLLALAPRAAALPAFLGGARQRRGLRTVGANDCLPGSFDVDCFLRGGECAPPNQCNRDGGFYTTYRVIDEPNGNGTLRVLGPADDLPAARALLPPGSDTSTARFAACDGFGCGCCIPCRVLTNTWPATQCRLAGGTCLTRGDCLEGGGVFDADGCGAPRHNRPCGCCLLPPSPSPPSPPPPA